MKITEASPAERVTATTTSTTTTTTTLTDRLLTSHHHQHHRHHHHHRGVDNQEEVSSSRAASISGGGGGGGSVAGGKRTRRKKAEMSSSHFVDLTNHMSYEASIAVILLCCKKRILYPYLRLISILGWRPLFFSAVEPPISIRFSNILYLLFIITIMVTGHFLEYAACHSDILSGRESPKFLHMLPSLFHLAAYLMVLYYSRMPESERLETLMERVFLQSSRNAGWLICHKKLMKQLRNFFLFCMFWVILMLMMRLMHYFWYEAVYKHAWMCNYDWPTTSDNKTFTTIRIACSTWNDLVCAAIVTTYSVHCQLNISYIKNLCTIVRERRIPIQEFFKRVEESRNFIDYLNSDQAVGVSLLMMYLLCRAGLSIIALLHPPDGVQFTWKATCVLAFSVASCLSLISINLKQSLKLTNACIMLRNIGHELKSLPPPVSIATENERDELDSLVLYTSTLDMEAKILQMPVRASYLSFLMISLTFLLLLLAQFGYINF